MDWRELLDELERRTRPGSWDELAPFRETFLTQLTDCQQRSGLRVFGSLLASLVTEAPGPAATPADGWRKGLSAVLADLRFVAGHLAVLSRDFLATEPEASARHAQARAAGELALELGHTAGLLQTLVSRRHGPAARKPRQGTAPDAAS